MLTGGTAADDTIDAAMAEAADLINTAMAWATDSVLSTVDTTTTAGLIVVTESTGDLTYRVMKVRANRTGNSAILSHACRSAHAPSRAPLRAHPPLLPPLPHDMTAELPVWRCRRRLHHHGEGLRRWRPLHRLRYPDPRAP